MGKKKKQEKQKQEKQEKQKKKKRQGTAAVKAESRPETGIAAGTEVPEQISDKYTRSILPRPGAETSEKAADVFRAFGDETRLQIMQILEGKELCNSELLQYVSVVQSTLSHHMRVLTDAGVVRCRRYGKFAYYSLCPDRFEHAIEWLRYYQAISAVPVKKEETGAEDSPEGEEDEQKRQR